MLLSELFVQNSVRNLARPALRYLGKETNYGELRTQIARLSYLYQNEIGQKARVAFFARNSPAYITTFLALTNNRAVTIPIDPTLPADQVAEWLKTTEATHLAVTSDLLGTAREIMQRERVNLPIIEIERKHGGEYDTTFSPPPDNRPVENDVILILRSGGATGKPKPVTFTHKQLAHAGTALRGLYHATTADRFLTTLSWADPFAFTHGFLLPLLLGATTVIDHGLEAKEFLDFIRESRATRLLGNPPFFLKLLVVCKNEKQPVPPLKSVTVAHGNLSPELRKAFSLFKIPVCQCYGMTENTWTIAMESADLPENPGDESAGAKGLPGLKYKVLDHNGDEIEGDDERIGQLAVTGPTVMQGYLKGMEKETKSAIRGTWLYTADAAKLVGAGDDLRISFLGRKDDLTFLDGELIELPRIDKALRAIVGIEDAAAFAVTNSRGERLIVAVVIKVQGNALNETQIKEHVSGKLPGGYVPQYIGFTDHIPRDAAGNVAYFKLRGQFTGLAG